VPWEDSNAMSSGINRETDNLGKELSTHLSCAVRLAPYSNNAKPIFECKHNIPFAMFVVKGAVSTGNWSEIIKRHQEGVAG
jgi:hypothetical protein